MRDTFHGTVLEQCKGCDEWLHVYEGDLTPLENDNSTYQFEDFGPRYQVKTGNVLEEDSDKVIGKCKLIQS